MNWLVPLRVIKVIKITKDDFYFIYVYVCIYIIAKGFSNPRKEGTPCHGDGKRK